MSLSEGKNLKQTDKERVFAHINDANFLTGEVLYYKIYCINSNDFNPSKISKIAYIELIDVDKKSVFKHKIFLKNSFGSGDYFVPTTLKTGNYTLIAYTNWMLNEPSSELFLQNITIINPYQVIEKNKFSTTGNPSIVVENKLEQIENNSIELNKNSFLNRELVSLKINSLEKGNYSISVRKMEELATNKKTKTIDLNNLISNNNEIKILPELRGENILGKIISKNNSAEIKNVIISLSISGEDTFLKTVRTNSEGKFIFNIDKPNYQSNLIVQVFDENRQNYTLTIDKPESPNYNNITVKKEVNINPELKSIIENKSIANQLENAYYNQKRDTIFKSKYKELFYEPVAKDYLLDDYTRFSTTKETITEVLKEMYYTQSKDNYKIGLRDYNPNSEAAQPSLVMIDGLIIQDLKELFDYKMSNVYKVSIIPGGYYFGSSLFNGLINFITKNKDFESKLSGDFILKPDILRPVLNKNYYKIDYSDKQKMERIPDFRYQLLWQSEINLENNINFYTSDVSGIFEISIEGFSDKGKPISISKTFEVK